MLPREAARTPRQRTAGSRRAASLLLWLAGLCALLQLLGLRIPLLSAFFFDTAHAEVQGIDFYSLPKAWLNLFAGRSLYGTFDPPGYGPHVTWFLSHPLLAVVLGWPLSRFQPAESYGVFTIFSLAVMASCAFAFARETPDAVRRACVWLLFLGAFPTFLMLWVGNVQPLLVLGLSLLLVGMLRLVTQRAHAGRCVVSGLLVSLFTKPVVLLTLPSLLLLRETRRAVMWALLVYLPVSAAFVALPILNPEGVGVARVAWLAVHPAYVRAHMDIYANHLQLTPEMRDNSVHWLNLVAQSGFRLQHIDVYSLPVFLDGVLGRRTPDWLYSLPMLLVLGLSAAVARLQDANRRREAALLLVLAASLDFFLAYPTVWEYQYTAVLPVAAVLLLWKPQGVSVWMRAACLALACCATLPSLYFLSGSASPDARVLLLARVDRVVPVTLLFALLCWCAARETLRQGAGPHTPTAPALGSR